MKKNNLKVLPFLIIATALLFCGCAQKASKVETKPESTNKESTNKESTKQKSSSEVKTSEKSSVKKESGYEIFTKDYKNISKNFHMKNFKEIGEGELQYSYVAFTKLKNFSEKNDMIDGDTLSPMKRKLYYYNSKEKMLIYITHIYMKQNMEKHLLTSDYPYEEVKSKYKLKVPFYSETYLCYRHTLVNLKVYSLKNSKSKLVSTGVKALKEYDSIIE